MRGDFSRLPRRDGTRFSGVLMQQGRVQLDADWNDQAEILSRLSDDLARDGLGSAGAPAAAPGFAVLALGGLAFQGGHGGWTAGEALLAAPEGLTLETWVAPADGGGAATVVEAVGEDVAISIAIDAGRLLQASVRGEAAGAVAVAAPQPIAAGAYTHVAVVHFGGALRLLVDGQRVAAASASAAVPDGRVRVCVGGTAEAPLSGAVDEVRLWARGLDDDEVRGGLASAPRPGARGLVGRWLHDGDDALPDGRDLPDGITRVERSLWLTPGRFYLGGMVCENVACRAVATPAIGSAAIIELVARQRTVSAVDDPAIAEIALGGVDTTVRTRVDWSVEARNPAAPEAVAAPAPTMQARRRLVSESLTNTLYRVEIHHSGWPAGGTGDVGAAELRVVSVAADGSGMTLSGASADGSLCAGRPAEFQDGSAWRLAWVVSADTENRTVVLGAAAAAAAAGDVVKVRPVASYKWARDNASVSARVVAVDGARAELRAGPRAVSEIRSGIWAEVAPADPEPRPRPLVLIEDVERTPSGNLSISVAEADAPVLAGAATLTLWAPGEAAPDHGVVPLSLGAWQPLENGVEVRFAQNAHLPAGAAWTLPARDRTQGIIWPEAGGVPAAVPALLPTERRAALALVTVQGGGLRARDLRRVFPSLASLAVPGGRHPGSLEVRGDLLVDHDAWIAGSLRAGRIDGDLAPGTVGTEQVRDRSITEEKLAMGDGFVPVDEALLGPSREAPVGFAYAGATVAARGERLAWRRVDATLPGGGPAVAASLDGRVYLLYGEGRFYRFDPLVEPVWFERLADMPDAPREGFTLTPMAGRLWLVGGIHPEGRRVAPLWRYDPERDVWEERATMLWPRSHHGAVATGDRLCVFGGRRRLLGGLVRDWVTAAAESYDADRDLWFETRPMPAAQSGMAVAAEEGVAHVVGGRTRRFWGLFGTRPVAWHRSFAPAEARWCRRPDLPRATAGMGAGAAGGRLLVFGGRHADGTSAGTFLFDSLAGHWRAGPLPDGPRTAAAAAVEAGRVFALGGKDRDDPADPGSTSVETITLEQVWYVHRRVGVLPGLDDDPGRGGSVDGDDAGAQTGGEVLGEGAADPLLAERRV